MRSLICRAKEKISQVLKSYKIGVRLLGHFLEIFIILYKYFTFNYPIMRKLVLFLSFLALISNVMGQPAIPTLHSIENTEDGTGVVFQWAANPEADDAAYRLYYTSNDDLSDWQLLAGEEELTNLTTSYTASDLAPTANGYFFQLFAVNTDGESEGSDVYARLASDQMAVKQHVLIVDAFDRYNASWTAPTHDFTTTYMKALRSTGEAVVSSCANEAVTEELVDLSNYDLVIWYTGDESTDDETISTPAQVKLSTYLDNGGFVFFTGAEYGWDLSNHGDEEDQAFYANYMKAVYDADGTTDNFPAVGLSGTAFEGLQLNFSQVYEEDWPDEISATDESTEVMAYLSGATCGVAYKGAFGEGTVEGGMVYFSFAVETVDDATELNTFADQLLGYFFGTSSGFPDDVSDLAQVQLYPSRVTTQAYLQFHLERHSQVAVSIYSAAGQLVMDKSLRVSAQNDRHHLNLSALQSGMYLMHLEGQGINQTIKFIKD